MNLTIIQIDVADLKTLIRETIEGCLKKKGPIASNRLMKIDEVCQMLKVSRVTIHTWKKKGKLPYHRISNRIFFKESDILGALERIAFRKKWSKRD